MITISKRLQICAELVPQGARVADVGCDHGYLGVYLLQKGRASFVVASDLRPKPLETAKAHASRYRLSTQMAFICTDGLAGIDRKSVDTIVCAGMGGDLIRMVLEGSPWTLEGRHTIILQPQSSQYELRIWLAEKGFQIERETPVCDAGHVYSAMRLSYVGGALKLAPVEAFVSDALLRSQSPDLTAYLDDTIRRLEQASENMKNAERTPEKLTFFETALAEIREVRKKYGHGS